MFNQKPYQPGTDANDNRCEKCQCNGHAVECRYNPEIEERGLSVNAKGKIHGGGVCINCQRFTTGINCEKCAPGYYRPFGVLPNATEPCVPCDCHDPGSEGHCMSLGGECMCKEGFTGTRCDQCIAGHRGPKCLKCGCDSRGTMQGGECESHCQCKLNVEGDNCDQCAPGYFGLNTMNPEGCTKCYCSGVSSICHSWSNISSTFFEAYEDWMVTDITNSIFVTPYTDPSSHQLIFASYELEIEAAFWSAPALYRANKLTSYGSKFTYQVEWEVVRGDTSGKPTAGPNLILIGSNGLKIAYGEAVYTNQTSATIEVELTEEGFYHVPKSVVDIVTSRQRRTHYKGDPVTRTQFMSVISNLEAVLLRATFHTDQAECILNEARIHVGSFELNAESGEVYSRVEECECPVGYIGTSCESCAFSYMRVYENTTTHETIAKCVPCNCNGHAKECNLLTDDCGECEHNTEGERCERCKEGYYGNALNGEYLFVSALQWIKSMQTPHYTTRSLPVTVGTPTDCIRCACPLSVTSNNFSPTCRRKESSIDMNHVEKNWYAGIDQDTEYVCTGCPLGYIGDHCEQCDDGYYGDPLELGSKCLPCPCNGGPCDPLSGECITCGGNTEGWRCERCKEGYWGNPVDGCIECECFDQGAVDNVCDFTTGQCKCRERYSGAQCQECDVRLDQTFNISTRFVI